MFQVFSHADDLRSRGINPTDTFLGPLLRRDAPGVSAPVVIRDRASGDETWLVKHQEKGAVEASPLLSQETVVFHSPYMLLEDDYDGVETNLASAVARVVDGQTVEVGPDLAIARVKELRPVIDLESTRPVGQGETVEEGDVVESLSAAAVTYRFSELRGQIVPAAVQVAAARPETTPLVELFDTWSADTRFDDLDELMSSTRTDAVIVVSEINVEELTAESDGATAALYLRSDDHVWTTLGPVNALAEKVHGSRVLVEENALGIEAATELERAGAELVEASDLLAKWRERLDHQYLPAIVLVTRASREGLDAATAWANEEVAAGRRVTEREVKDHYLAHVRELAESWGVPGTIREFFSNCHAAQRTLHPALASDHVIDDGTTTLKLDAGLALVVDGVTLATSDVASLYVRNEAALRTEAIFRDIVRDTITDSIQPGTVFEDIHAKLLDRLYEQSDELKQLGFWPEDIDLRERYGWRNVGHLMGRQESFSSEFRPGDREVVRVGDYGACEIQWPFADHAFGVEDMWIATPHGPIILTR